jgi:hypothetical protein
LRRGLARSCFLFLHCGHPAETITAYTNALQMAQIWLHCGRELVRVQAERFAKTGKFIPKLVIWYKFGIVRLSALAQPFHGVAQGNGQTFTAADISGLPAQAAGGKQIGKPRRGQRPAQQAARNMGGIRGYQGY